MSITRRNLLEAFEQLMQKLSENENSITFILSFVFTAIRCELAKNNNLDTELANEQEIALYQNINELLAKSQITEEEVLSMLKESINKLKSTKTS